MKVYVPFEFKMAGRVAVEAKNAGEAFDKGFSLIKNLTRETLMKKATPDWDALDVNMDENLEDEYGRAVFIGYEEC